MPGSGLVHAVRQALAERADPVRAEQQQAYMKSAMPFRGIPVPEVRRLTGALVRGHPLEDRAAWESAIRELWDTAAYREERYAALAIARHARHRHWASGAAALELYRHLVLTGRWWDLCDETSHLIGAVLVADPVAVTPILRRWAQEDDVWIRRSAILSQLDRKTGTDADLLTHAIEESIDDPDFFARKAIGWALRQYARVAPGWVRSFVTAHPGLSRLSVREALRRLD